MSLDSREDKFGGAFITWKSLEGLQILVEKCGSFEELFEEPKLSAVDSLTDCDSTNRAVAVRKLATLQGSGAGALHAIEHRLSVPR